MLDEIRHCLLLHPVYGLALIRQQHFSLIFVSLMHNGSEEYNQESLVAADAANRKKRKRNIAEKRKRMLLSKFLFPFVKRGCASFYFLLQEGVQLQPGERGNEVALHAALDSLGRRRRVRAGVRECGKQVRDGPLRLPLSAACHHCK